MIARIPEKFSKLALGHSLWGKQIDIAESVRKNKRTTVRSCNGAGKSFTAADIILWYLSTRSDSIILTTAPTFRQVKDILWKEINNTHSRALLNIGGNLLDTALTFGEKWYATGLSTDQPDRFQGYHAVRILIVVDEAAGVDERIFGAIEGNLSSEHSRLLLIGNPTNLSGTFYNSFKQDNYNHIHISAFDTPNFTAFGITIEDIRKNTWREKITAELPRPYLVTPEWVYDKFLAWGEDNPMWQARVMGEFPQQGDDTLIPLIYIEQATQRQLEVKEEDEEMIGADIARFGTDKTPFAYRKGPKIMDIHQHAYMDTMATSQVLHTYCGMHPRAGANIDEIGVGAGVVDRMKQLNPYKTIQGINVGVAANDPEMFFNLRAEMFWALRERFVDGSIQIPNDEELKGQLASIKYKYTPKGQVQIESKEDMKKRGLPSPDKADAVALSFLKAKPKPNLIDFMSAYKTKT